MILNYKNFCKDKKQMNKKQVVASLNKIANELDDNGLYSEANTVTQVMSKIAMDENDEYNTEDYGICPDCGEYIGDEDYCIECDWNVEKDEDGPDFGDLSDEDYGDPNAWQYEDNPDEDLLDREHRQKNDFPHHEDFDDF